MAEALDDRMQDPYMDNLDLSTSEHLKLYDKAIFELPERDRYVHTKYEWTDLYQWLKDDVSIFWFKAAVFIVTFIYVIQVPTEVKDIIMSHPYIK